jgi:hypothetical protein
MEYPLPGQVYKHYKGGTYKILTMASHTETKLPLVIYQSIPFGSIYARPLSMWEDVCEHEDRKVKRFTLQSI